MNSGDSGSGGSTAVDFSCLQLDPGAFVIAGNVLHFIFFSPIYIART